MVTKVGNLRYLGMLRQDSKGQEYWKYKPLTTSEQSGEKSSAIQTNSASTKVEEETVEKSPQVEKFQQKYGTASNPK